MASRNHKKIAIKVVFDTNAIFNAHADYLLSLDVATLIDRHSDHVDIAIEWCIPDIVMRERRYQMTSKAFDLTGAIRKLERLIGVNLNITEDTLKADVQRAIERQIEKYKLTLLKLDTQRVPWETVIENSVSRRPPFQAGEKEKGFRDALILECLVQLVECSPVSPKTCRIAFVTSDGALQEAARSRLANRGNVRIIGSPEELSSLINTIDSSVTEEYISPLKEKAHNLIKENLYSKFDLNRTLEEKFYNELVAVPAGADAVLIRGMLLTSTGFIRKEGQRIFWATRLKIEAEAIKKIQKTMQSEQKQSGQLANIPIVPYNFEHLGNATRHWVTMPPNYSAYFNAWADRSAVMEDIPVTTGEIIFEITWHTTVTAKQALTKMEIDNIRYVETIWA